MARGGEGRGVDGPESVEIYIYIYICISIRFARFAFAENVRSYACVRACGCARVCVNASNADAAIAAKLQLTMYNVIVSHAMFRTPPLPLDC